MNISAQFRTVALASLLALTVVTHPTAQANAEPNTNPDPKAACEARGFLWDSVVNKCLDKTCNLGGKFYGGETIVLFGKVLMCDGTTGQWIEVGRVHPSWTRADLQASPTTIAP